MQPCEDEHLIPDRKITDAIGHRGIERQPSLGTTLHTLLGSARGIDQRRLDDSDWTNLVRHALLRALGPPDALVGLISFDHGVGVDPDQGNNLFAGERRAETRVQVDSSSPRHLQRVFRTTPVSRASSGTCTGDLPDDLRELILRPVRDVTVRIEAAPYSSEEFLGAKGLLVLS